MYGVLYAAITIIIMIILNMIFLYQKASREGHKKTMTVLVTTTLVLLIILAFLFKGI